MNLASYKAGNNFKTFVFVAALTGLLIAIGYLIGGASGLIVFAAIAVVFNFFIYWFSGPVALKTARAVEVSPQQDPELHEMIARLAERAGVPKPSVYVTPAEQPNAFATGRNPKHAAIAVTAGIRRALGPHARQLRVEPGFGVGSDTCHFGFKLERGCRLSRHARFLRGELTQRFGFELRLCLREPRFCRFFPEAFQIGSESGLRFRADPAHFGFERARRRVMRRTPRFLCGFVATFVGFALCLFLGATSLLGFDTQTFELGGEP